MEMELGGAMRVCPASTPGPLCCRRVDERSQSVDTWDSLRRRLETEARAVHRGSSFVTMNSIKHEIEALHEFFVAWFTGGASASRFDAEFLARFDCYPSVLPPRRRISSLE